MEADEYVAECIMRDRLAMARARTERAALQHQWVDDHLVGPGIGRRLIERALAFLSRRGPKRAKTPGGAAALPAPRSAR